MPAINPERLLADLQRLRQFGAVGNGVVRPALSAIDIESRTWLRDRMRAAGLDATIDGIGTVFGRSTRPGPALIIGSHTDTQPQGGWLDGAMGVMYGLEVARAFAESGDCADLAVDVASWMDEEGRFAHFVGSRAFFELLPESEFETARAPDGESLGAALERAAYAGRERVCYEPARHRAYLEAHVEQGGRLEADGLRIGVVSAIVGIRAFRISFEGEQNHAGTTPMAVRRDAAMALIRFAHALDARFASLAADNTVWTFGNITVSPGAESIVPGGAELYVQFRDADAGVLDSFEAAVRECVADATDQAPVDVTLSGKTTDAAPAVMDPALQTFIADAAERRAPSQWIRMPSGAGHDAQVTAPLLPSGMLFVPSIGGISHSFAEDTDSDDIVLGCQVLADAAEAFLRTQR